MIFGGNQGFLTFGLDLMSLQQARPFWLWALVQATLRARPFWLWALTQATFHARPFCLWASLLSFIKHASRVSFNHLNFNFQFQFNAVMDEGIESSQFQFSIFNFQFPLIIALLDEGGSGLGSNGVGMLNKHCRKPVILHVKFPQFFTGSFLLYWIRWCVDQFCWLNLLLWLGKKRPWRAFLLYVPRSQTLRFFR